MKQVALRILLAFALVLQGGVAVPAVGSLSTGHEQCGYHQAMTSMTASMDKHASHCPCCPQRCPCPGHHCPAFCAGCAAVSLLVPDEFAAATAHADSTALRAPPTTAANRSDSPPTRPPIS